MIQASADGILTMLATGNDRPNLFEIFIANDRRDFSVSIRTGDHNDLANTGCTLKCVDCVGDDRSAGDRRNNLSKPMRRLSPAATMMVANMTKKRNVFFTLVASALPR